MFLIVGGTFKEVVEMWPTYTNNVLSALDTVILAPIWEEILYRGLFIESLKKKIGNETLLCLLSSIFFGALHFSLTVCLGSYFYAKAYIRQGNLLECIFCHILWNSIQVVSGFSFKNGYGCYFLTLYLAGLLIIFFSSFRHSVDG